MSAAERGTEPNPPDALVEELLAAYGRELWPTARLDDPQVLDELRTLAGRIAAALVPAVRAHRLLTGTELGVVRRLDALSFARQLPRHDVVRLHHVAPKVVHRHIAASPPDEATGPRARIEHYRRTSAAVLGITSQIRTSLFESTLPRTPAAPADRDPDPGGSVLAELLSGRTGAAEATRQEARDTGLVLGPNHIVAAMEADAGVDLLRDVVPAVEEALHDGPYRAHSGIHDGRAVLVLPLDQPDRGPNLTSALEGVFEACHMNDRVRAGIGHAQPELPGIRTSYEQSLRVLGLLREAPALGTTMAFDDALPYLTLHADPALSLEIQSVMEPLVVYDQAEGTDLVRTLEAVLDNPGNLTDVSRTLHVHRHTLYNRVERIEELTHRSLSKPDDRLLLELALRASRLLP